MPSLDDLRAFARYHLVRRVEDHPAPETELVMALARELAVGSRGRQ